MKRGVVLRCGVALAVAMIFLPSAPASAIPAFAKKWGYSCASCHNAWPMLNAFGRRFKENGYKVDRDQELGESDHVKAEDLALYKFTFFTIKLTGLPVDKEKDEPLKLQPLAGVDIMAAGNISEKGSFWTEVEAENEEEFKVGVESAFVGIHPITGFNGVAGFGPVFWVDPYQTLAEGGRRLTLAPKPFAALGFSTEQGLRESTPQIAAYGRLRKRVFYEGAITSGSEDAEGQDRKDFMGRLAFDVNDNVMVGGYAWSGERSISDELGAGFSRAGIDFQLQYDHFSIFGNWMHAQDDLFEEDEGVVNGSESNDLFSFTGLYVVPKGKRPLVVPIVRIDSYEFEGGGSRYTDGTINLTFYAYDNWNVAFEFWANLSTPSGVPKDNRATLLFTAAF